MAIERNLKWRLTTRSCGIGAVALCLCGQIAAAECLRIGDTGYVLPVDGEVTVTKREGSVQIDLAPGARAPQLITFYTLAGLAVEGASAPSSALLPNGLTLQYSTQTRDAEGSGGAEVMLSGWLEGGIPLAVSCETQTEYGGPEWCVPVLGTLRPVETGCENEDE